MAYNDSGELPIGQSYQLGEYVFSISVTPDPGEGTTGINVRCDKGDERAVVSGEVTGTVESWSVEANETEASVYIQLEETYVPDVPHASTAVVKASGTSYLPRTFTIDAGGQITIYVSGNSRSVLGASSSPGAIMTGATAQDTITTPLSSSYTLDGKTVYYGINTNTNPDPIEYAVPQASSIVPNGPTAWGMVYGQPSGSGSELVARFAIDLREAGGGPGEGPGERWDEPGDTGDPSYTLNVNVTGATAGTHDAAAVPSAPADQPVYGSGGAGGNGGGGGAGQPTAIVRRFATSRAGSVNQEVTLRPPGVGSKGSPGGKGGDGCILIFW